MTTDRRAAAKVTVPTINLASIVYGLDAYMRSRGAHASEALRRAGLEPGDLTDPDRRVPLIRYLELLEICADVLADRQFGLKFGARYEPRHAGVVGNVALASRTVGEAFETMGRYLPTMVDATVHGLEVSDGVAFVYFYYIDPLMMSYRQKADWAIAFACNIIRVGLRDPGWTPQEVLLPQLADETPAQRRVRAEVMGDNIRVGHPWAGIRFEAGLLERPMATADAMIESLMRHYGDLRLAALPERHGEIEQLRREIARLLVKGESGIEHLADATGTSVRTLQRRLKDAGVSYHDLQNDVRKTLALNLLENETLALSEIAFSLGYSEVSAFNHAFRRWVGQSPGDYRRLRAVTRSAASATSSI
ncbi:MAG TPA: AraC family transcriptional regulator ligand-binding domain-containing protein [Xanthobacteraceae bacterium]|nr:AraC family transcriptional regulator ligand-binding domain-containing protein [Xanthobacteraceae bacterium]